MAWSRRWTALAGVALFLVALCSVPYHVPLAPSVSESYYFGYNNRVAELLIVAGAVLVAIFGPDARPAVMHGKELTPRLLYRWLAITFVVAAFLQIVAHRVDGFGEGIYLIDRVKLAMAGQRPYFQFEYPYGALLLYGPVFLARILHVGAGDGYALFWILNCVGGTYLLYWTLRWIDIPQGRQRAAFVFFSSYGLLMMPVDGVNYTLFRYVPGCFFAVGLYRLSRRRIRGAALLPMLLAVPCTAFLLLLSPELAISFSAGMVVYFAVWGGVLRDRQSLVGFTGMLLGLSAVGTLAARLGVFVTMKTYSTGAYNLPIVPGPHILLFLAALALSACYVGSCFRRKESSALLVLVCTSAVSLAGALGRCDRVHTLMNPLGIVLVAVLVETSHGWFHRAWWWAVWFVFLWMLIPGNLRSMSAVFGKIAMQEYLMNDLQGRWPAVDRMIQRRMDTEIGPELAQRKLADMRAFTSAHGAIDLNRAFGFPEGTVSEAPFGFSPSRFGTMQTPDIDEGYYFEHQNMGIPAAVERKADEMRIHPERPLLLLPDRQISCVLVPEVQRGFVEALFSFPYTAEVKHPVSVTEPLCAYIRDHYREAQPPVPEHFGYAVWLHK